ncbi:MAG: Lacal_2735 family protein [Myxococcales bacterium]|nr:Lacal_2735 family protein [Myxococcales bacterium]
MFGWLRSDPKKKLQKRYEAKMRQAKEAEKFGDRALQAELYTQAEALYAELEALEAETPGT